MINDDKKLEELADQLNKYFEFSFTLKTCLHLDPEVSFNIDSLGTVVKTEEKIEEFDSRYGRAERMEITSDTDAAFRFTRLKVIIPDPDQRVPLENLEKIHGEKILSSINIFINSYRALTSRYGISIINGLSNLPDKNVFRPNSKGGGTIMTSISFVGSEKNVTLSPHKPLRSTDEHQKLQEMLNSPSLSLSKMFLMDAYKYHQTYQDIQSLINAVVALELSLWNYKIQRKPSVFGLIYRFFYKYKNLQIKTKYFLLENSVKQESINNIIRSIKERNKIVHGGQRKIKGNMEKYLEDISYAIQLTDLKK